MIMGRGALESVEIFHFYCKWFRYFKVKFESHQNSHQKSQNHYTKVAKKFTVSEMVIINVNKYQFAHL